MTHNDLLEHTSCRVRLLADLFCAANPSALSLSEGGTAGLALILNDIACDIERAMYRTDTAERLKRTKPTLVRP